MYSVLTLFWMSILAAVTHITAPLNGAESLYYGLVQLLLFITISLEVGTIETRVDSKWRRSFRTVSTIFCLSYVILVSVWSSCIIMSGRSHFMFH
jgi:hypothetical protein